MIIDESRKSDVLNLLDLLNHGKLPLIGSGYTANIYKYNDLAIKVLNAEDFDEEDLWRMTLKEAEVMYRLKDSQYTPKLIAFDEANFIVVMQFIDGIILADINDNDILNKVNYHYRAFTKECILADISPEDVSVRNVMLSDGKFIFIDFGYYSVGGLDEDEDWNEDWEHEID